MSVRVLPTLQQVQRGQLPQLPAQDRVEIAKLFCREIDVPFSETHAHYFGETGQVLLDRGRPIEYCFDAHHLLYIRPCGLHLEIGQEGLCHERGTAFERLVNGYLRERHS